jgi:2-polyprenyl-6-methoxyphenol hydroxylase-like FAD-dependent oxidoreductase
MPNKEKVLTKHEVIKVESNAHGVIVVTKNGSVFKGDIVVGADGINSAVRKSLWDLTRLRDPIAGEKASSRKYLFSWPSNFCCSFIPP